MATAKIVLSIVTEKPTASWSFGEPLLRTMIEVDSRLEPEVGSDCEPIKTKLGSYQEMAQFWSWDSRLSKPIPLHVLWKRKRTIKSEAQLIHSRSGAVGQLAFLADWNQTVAWPELLRRLIPVCEPVLGMIHLLHGDELEDKVFPSPAARFQRGTLGSGLAQGIPNLGWSMYFGPRYQDAFDADCLRQKAHSAEKIGDGTLLTITPDIEDVMKDYAAFDAARQQLKTCFRPGLILL